MPKARAQERTGKDGDGAFAPAAELARALARELVDVKADAVRILDVRGLTDVTDFMVLATGMSDRHLGAMSDAVRVAVRAEGRKLLGSEGSEGSGWIVVDAGDVVAHVFSAALRAYYDLDGLWADAKVLEACAKKEKEAGE